ncbi:o-phosphoseryl-trna selenium transferase [Stylonychia lemnae]|uniref:O-phosphoseryl-tRNA(Sec) selenium transferase n=1 Tax=Stylonychia lemnae TaxID=5949 RepID=A0A078AE47_STYLE|nr:o-phosphoseryl-trna selenium transferase [Stylonychia lemnae]|eukprot:CDW79188.1 o-phosphoseryl-trna selenium transferase [Stylonychia lemnae]
MDLLNHRAIPQEPMEELTIQSLMNRIALMDSNNYYGNTGVGEREGRIFSPIVRQKNFDLGHGIGRSGDVNALQPKAIGSSLIVKLTKNMTINAMNKILGYTSIKDALILPFATGMSLTVTLLTIKSLKPQAQYVIFPRIDQKTCLKCIYTANLVPIIVEPKLEGEELRTNLEEIKRIMEAEEYKDKILCVQTTTSCFAPRAYDSIAEVAEICRKYQIHHVINNAYGLQCTRVANDVCSAIQKGRVDALISSTDKNFMVPVGGSIIYSPKKKDLIDKINKFYPGRASGGPIVDLFITYLQMGAKTMKQLIKQRKENFEYLKTKLNTILLKYNERILETKNNKISMAVTLINLNEKVFKPNNINATFFGSYLFSRRVSGVRVVNSSNGKRSQPIGENTFLNYGSHSENYPFLPYFTCASAIGQKKEEIDVFVIRLQDAFENFLKNDPQMIIVQDTLLQRLNVQDEEQSANQEEEKQQ